MDHPYQCICVASRADLKEKEVLIAACGPDIFCVGLESGEILAQWPDKSSSEPFQSESAAPREEGPPGKKRKIANGTPKLSNVIKLVLSPDCKHCVAVTGDDKCVRVFEIASEGKLIELSQRCMPKRPCAIQVTPNGQTILCGDKFGDVYALPLIPSEVAETISAHNTPNEEPKKEYTPAATNLTVHSARNRRALEEQLKRKGTETKSKEPLKFEHQLLLGHVSMLTDMQVATEEVDGKTRQYIITSDRDEHIRISRGPPQAHIIERYCLGHTEFISKLLLIPELDMLLSAGGDQWLGVWNWKTGKLLAKQDLVGAMKKQVQDSSLPPETQEGHKIAVSGLWAVPGKTADTNEVPPSPVVIVAIEGCSQPIEFFPDWLDNDSSKTQDPEETTLLLKGCRGRLIDVKPTKDGLIMSYDPAKDDPNKERLRFRTLQSNGSKTTFISAERGGPNLDKINSLRVTVADRKAVDDLLYGVEKLRKRENEEPEGDE